MLNKTGKHVNFPLTFKMFLHGTKRDYPWSQKGLPLEPNRVMQEEAREKIKV
jgi:hypothetical protein